jgi:hypothetical protein
MLQLIPNQIKTGGKNKKEKTKKYSTTLTKKKYSIIFFSSW